MAQTLHIVKASAGSGKTYRLALNYIAVAIMSPNPRQSFRSILAVTFTNKATAEMKQRIIAMLKELMSGSSPALMEQIMELTQMTRGEVMANSEELLSGILTDYSAFAVSTIDTFFQRIVRSFFYELGLDLRYEIVLEREQALQEAIEQLVRDSRNDEELSKKIWRFVSSNIEQGKRVNIQRELSSLYNEASMAGVLSGSDVDIAQRERTFAMMQQVYDGEKALYVELCAQAVQRIESQGADYSDFKGKSRSFVSYFYKVLKSGAVEKFTKAVLAIDKDSSPVEFITNPAVEALTAQLLDTVFKLRELHSTIKTFEALQATFLRYSLLSHLEETVSTLMAQRGELDIASTPELLKKITGSGEIPFIFEKLGTRYSVVFIDEFQDTSRSQWEVFLPLLQEALSKAQTMAVMLIGDVKQAIYRWRGGEWSLLGGEAQRALSFADQRLENLSTSWRSHSEIVDFNNNLFEKVVKNTTHAIDDFAQSSAHREALVEEFRGAYDNYKQDLPPHKIGAQREGYVELTAYGEAQTLDWVVQIIREQRERMRNPQIAILVRKGSEANLIAERLLDEGIEFVSEAVLKVGKSRVVGFVVNVLRYSTVPSELHLAAINSYLGRELKNPLQSDEQELLNRLSPVDLFGAVEQIVAHWRLSELDVIYLSTFYTLCHNFGQNSGVGATSAFVEAWDEKLSSTLVTLSHNAEAVNIITIHKSKGLEYDTVIVPYCNWKFFSNHRDSYVWCSSDEGVLSELGCYPLKNVKGLADTKFREVYFQEGVSSIIDAVNMLYVALTRPRAELYVGIGDELEENTIASIIHRSVPFEQMTTFGQKSQQDNPSSHDAGHGEELVVKSLSSVELPPLA